MQTTPRSANTTAPASSLLSLVFWGVNVQKYIQQNRHFCTGSEVTAAVRPTPLAPRPVVITAFGATA